jgi:RNA polymerase sigma-70 factor (ECF subfamily)
VTVLCLQEPTSETDLASAAEAAADIDFRDLVRRHHKSLYAFILRRIGNASDAEELAQQTFVAAATSIASFRGESALSTWLYGVAMNLVRNHLSREPARRYRFEDASALDDLDCPAATPQAQLESKQLVATIENELKALPSDMREVLTLVGLNELSYEEAAVLLSVPVGTVRSRVSRARDLLRRRLMTKNVAIHQ